jgi:two-component system, LuxR family, response regulator FixJ
VDKGTFTVCVVDDDACIRDVLSRLLTAAGHEVERYACGADFLAAYSDDRIGCVVLDASMPDLNGLQVQEALNARGATASIIFLTGCADVPMTVQALKAGAAELLQKPVSNEVLLKHVAATLERVHAARARRRDRQTVLSRYRRLTPRERQVLTRIAQGAPNKVIAGDLQISQRTVEVHRARLMRKMQTHSLAQLVQMALCVDADPTPHS